MKRTLTLLIALVMLLSCVPAGAETLMGGWSTVAHEAQPLPEEAQAAFDKATAELVGCNYKPLALLATQVVAGTNYCVLCELSPVVLNPVPYFALVYIYADLQGNATVTRVAELDLAGLSQPPVE